MSEPTMFDVQPVAPAIDRFAVVDVPTARTLFVPGSPAPQGSKSPKGILPNGRARMVESSKFVGPWRERIALAANQAGWTPVGGPMVVCLRFVMPRPASAPKRSTPPAIKRPDLDKLARAVLDALTGIAWNDDSQVIDLHAIKRIAEIGETGGVHIQITGEA